MQLDGARGCRAAGDVSLASEALIGKEGYEVAGAVVSVPTRMVFYTLNYANRPTLSWYNLATKASGEHVVQGLVPGMKASCLDVSPDGKTVALGLRNGEHIAAVIVFSVGADGTPQQQHLHRTEDVNALCFLSDNRTLAFTAAQLMLTGISLWDLGTGEMRSLAGGHMFEHLCCVPRPGSPLLVGIATRADKVAVWEVASGQRVAYFPFPAGLQWCFSGSVFAATPDGRHFAIHFISKSPHDPQSDKHNRTTLVYNTNDWSLAAAQPHPSVPYATAMAATPDSRRLAAAVMGLTCSVQVHHLDSGQPQFWFKAAASGEVRAMAWLSTARSVGEADELVTVAANRTVRVWRLDPYIAWNGAAAAAAGSDVGAIAKLCSQGIHNAARDPTGRTMLHIACEKGGSACSYGAPLCIRPAHVLSCAMLVLTKKVAQESWNGWPMSCVSSIAHLC